MLLFVKGQVAGHSRIAGGRPVFVRPYTRREHLHQLMATHGDGLELRHDDDDKWAVMMPDASHAGAYRYQEYGPDGFGYHHTFGTREEAIEDAGAHGYLTHDPGSLERFMMTPAWEAGMERQRQAGITNGEVVAKALQMFLKTHISGYTRKDGVFVAAHQDKRKPASVLLFKPNPLNARQGELFGEEPKIADIKPNGEPVAIAAGPDLSSYDKVLVAFSGGKDSVACVLALLENGVPREKMELHHHDIDGDGASFMDWPITKDYCRKFAQALGIPIYFSWRQGGFEREMMRDNQRTAPVNFEKPDGTVGQAGGIDGMLGTRKKFPQQSASLTTRWCSGALKVDVMAIAIRNQDRFTGKRTLVVTGERAEESSNRAKYETFAPDRANSSKRTVDHYMPVHAWKEKQVWDVMHEHGIVPHPAYQLGYGRLSCRHCIFAGTNQIATNNALYPESTGKIAAREKEFGITIHRKEDLMTRAAKGKPYQAAIDHPEIAAQGDAHEWTGPMIVPKSQWKQPAGAFGEKDGPC